MPESEDEKQEDQKPARPMVRFEKRNNDIEKGIQLNAPSRDIFPDIRAQSEPDSLAEYMRRLKDLDND